MTNEEWMKMNKPENKLVTGFFVLKAIWDILFYYSLWYMVFRIYMKWVSQMFESVSTLILVIICFAVGFWRGNENNLFVMAFLILDWKITKITEKMKR